MSTMQAYHHDTVGSTVGSKESEKSNRKVLRKSVDHTSARVRSSQNQRKIVPSRY